MCRDQTVGTVAMTVMPDLIYMELTPFSHTAAVVAMMVGENEYRALCANGGDPRTRR